ncbi:MAG: hypothetical protein LUQ20_02375, partial [Candidatus Methanoperedens sp.]|nr:hypothetical protein [Candidatus Methanoperedens sp.]
MGKETTAFDYEEERKKFTWDIPEDELCWATTEPGWAKWYWAPFGAVLNAGATNFHYTGRFHH